MEEEEEITVGLFSHYTPTITGICENLAHLMPLNSFKQPTKWILKKIKFNISENNINSSSVKIVIGRTNKKQSNGFTKFTPGKFDIYSGTLTFTIAKKKKELIEEYDYHFVVKSGEFLIPEFISIGKNSYGWSMFLTFEEHFSDNECCEKYNSFTPMKQFRRNAFENIIILEDL